MIQAGAGPVSLEFLPGNGLDPSDGKEPILSSSGGLQLYSGTWFLGRLVTFQQITFYLKSVLMKMVHRS